MWILIRRTDTESPILWPPDVKNQLTGKDPETGKDWRQKEKGAAEDEMIRYITDSMNMNLSKLWENSRGQRSLACYSPWACKEWTQLSYGTTTTAQLKHKKEHYRIINKYNTNVLLKVWQLNPKCVFVCVCVCVCVY